MPGGSTKIGGKSINSDLEDLDLETPAITLELDNDQLKDLDNVKLNINIIEKNVSDEGVNVSRDLFDIKEEFKIADLEYDEATDGYVNVDHEGEEFVIRGILTNTGHSPSKGNEKIYIIKQDNWDKPLATSDYINLNVNEQEQFVMSIDDNTLYGNEYGYDDLVLFVKNDKGDILSEYVIATINADFPYNFKVNGQSEKIKIKVGESINLNTTYEPSDRFINANIAYSINDYEIANVIDNKLYAVNEGTTVLNLSALEYGGNKSIEIEVVPNTGGDDRRSGRRDSGSDSSGGGAGPIPNNKAVINSTKVGHTKYIPTVLDFKTN